MIQLNLLPDVKQHFMKAKRTERMAILSVFIVTAAAVGLFVILFLAVNVWQKKSIRDLNGDIAVYSKELKDIQDLDRILTVQQQLKSLPSLHDQKPAVKRLFVYLGQVTPSSVNISELKVDFAGNTFEISGDSDKLENVNKFVDTLKFTRFKLNAEDEGNPAFSNVVLTSFARDADRATYSITLSYQAEIFDSTKTDVQLVVPQNFITSRSETEQPQALFQGSSEPDEEEESQ